MCVGLCVCIHDFMHVCMSVYEGGAFFSPRFVFDSFVKN